VALRKDFTPPAGKSLIVAEIIITAANTFEFYVNGDYVGSGTPNLRGGFAQRFCIDLLPSLNVFAANASADLIPQGAFIATILLTYSDFTQDTLVSDSSWRVNKGFPLGFEQLSFDDTAWPVATVATYAAANWPNLFIPTNPPVLGLAGATWVWTDVVPASGNLPVGSRAFRRIFTPAPGQVPATANIIISAERAYTLYVNGVTVGTGTNWQVAQHYVVNFSSAPNEIVLAAIVTNTAVGRAGLLLSMEVSLL
jgi:hypothetical protein